MGFYEDIQPGWTVIDGGGGDGEVALDLVKKVGPLGRVVVIEASPPNMHRIKDMVGRLPQVEFVEAALWSEPGRMPFYHSLQHHLTSSLIRDNCVSENDMVLVNVTTLDDLTRHWTKLHAVKLDLQGADLPALCGAVETLRRFRPLLYVEVWPWGMKNIGLTVEDLRQFLTEHHYRVQSGNVEMPETQYPAETPSQSSDDWYCVPA